MKRKGATDVTPEEVAAFRRLHAYSGWTINRIAREFGRHRQTVSAAVRGNRRRRPL